MNKEDIAPKMKAFVINGKGGAGKDQFVTYVREVMVEKHGASPDDVINVSSVAEIKEIAIQHFGWDGVTKSPEWRKALSDLKDIQTRMCDGPLNYMWRIGLENLFLEKVLFFHIREPEEIRRFTELVKGHTTKAIIVNRGIKGDYGNHADDNVNNYNYDIAIMNTGTLEHLKKQAENFIDLEIKS